MKTCTMVLAALLLLLGAAPPHAAAAGGLDKVTIQLNWLPEPEFGGIYAAAREGIFKKHGLDVQILKGGPDVPAVQMAVAGKVEFAVAAGDEVVAVRDKGADLVAIYAIYQTAPQGIMVKPDRPVKDIPALLKSGGTLIAQPGLAYLKFFKEKYDLSNVKIIPYGSGAMGQFVDPENKDVAMQCFVFSEPLTAKAHGIEPKVFLIADTGFNPYTGVIVTNGDYLENHRPICRRFAAALRDGWAAYLKDPEPANEVMAKLNPSMDRKTFTTAAEAQKYLIENGDTKRYGLGTMTMERWKTLTRQLFDLKIVDTMVQPNKCFVNP